MSASALIIFFQVASLIGSACLSVKLFRTGLYRKYRFFFLFFVFQIPNTAWPLFLRSTNSDSYFYVWVTTTPLNWIFYILVVMELYNLVLSRHRGLYSLGRWIMYVAIVVSVLLSFLSLLPRITSKMPMKTKTLGYAFAAERGLDFSLALFILLILLFLTRYYPVPLSRNVRVHAALYAIYFMSCTVAILVRTMLGKHVDENVNVFLTGISAACVFAWLVLLSAKGEEVHQMVPAIGSDSEERVLRHLNSLNATLLKVSHQK